MRPALERVPGELGDLDHATHNAERPLLSDEAEHSTTRFAPTASGVAAALARHVLDPQ